MTELVKNVTNYLDYLISELRLNASVHFSEETYPDISEGTLAALIPYIIHRNPYCAHHRDVSHNLCMENQKRMIASLRDNEPKEFTCYAGARELVYPIQKNRETVGFISISGYKGTAPSISHHPLWQTALSDSDIPRTLTDTLIPPLKIMLERLLELEPHTGGELNLILDYLESRYKDITLSALAEHFGKSPSHISHLFKKKTGMTLRAWCNRQKLYSAKNLLLTTDMSITEIALESGFEDVSYFIYLFREHYSVTPYRYRKLHST